MTKKIELLYEGKAKTIYATEKKEEIIMVFKDTATALNGLKKEIIAEKGVYNNKISTLIYKFLEQNGIKTHWRKTLNEREQLCEKVTIIPLEIIVRNRAAGSFSKRLGMEEGSYLKNTIFEMSYKNDLLADPLINDDHALALGIVSEEELCRIKKLTLEINSILVDLLEKANLILVDFKIELGKNSKGEIVLADEISPDSMRLWDKETLEKLDKDRFRHDLGGLILAYEEVLTRLVRVIGK